MTDAQRHEAGADEGAVNAPPAAPTKRKAPRQKPPRLLPPWKLILHNDDVNEARTVVKVIQLLTPLKEQEATARMLEAHKTGSSLLLVTHQERAELYVEQFASCRLTVTAEPDA